MLYNSNKVICIGSLGKDIFLPIDGDILETPQDILSQKKMVFELGAKYKVEKRWESVGGCAANVAQGLSRLEVKSACYAAIGKDELGLWLKKKLKKNKVSINYLQYIKNIASDWAAIVVDKKSHDHVIFYDRQAGDQLKVDFNKIKNFSWIFVGSLNGKWVKNLEQIIKVIQKKNSKLIFNPGQKNIQDNPKKIIYFLKFTEVLMVNKDEAMEIVYHMSYQKNSSSLEKIDYLIKQLSSQGVKKIIITEGKKGVYYYHLDDQYYYKINNQKVMSIIAKDTTGAGDAFNSGFLASLIKGNNFRQNLRWGMANSENVVKYYGAQEGLLRLTEMKKKSFDDYKIKKIKIH